MYRSLLLIAASAAISQNSIAQCQGWQQRGDVTMSVDLDVETHTFSGTQTLVYRNNSPDELNVLFYHLYFNAFKPNSEMDVRSRTIEDPDSRIGSRILELQPNEIGDLQVVELTQNKKPVAFEHLGTVLKVMLASPIRSGGKAVLSMKFKGQVPIQVRRSGRDNKENVAYSMTQWYPKIAEYDARGWHADPYVSREFYGVWGDYDVRMTLDSKYTVASTGVIQNASEVGHGYTDKKVKHPSGSELTWRFKAENVHDFAWAADPEYVHTSFQVPEGPLLRFFRKDDDKLKEPWDQFPEYMSKAFTFMSENFGRYPYPVYNFVQGGDGGMEYPMLTLITGKRRLGSLVGVSVHESAHSWYYGVLASNEAKYPWMDEGFTEFASSKTMAHLFPDSQEGDPHSGCYMGYFRIVEAGKDEPMSTHADHYKTNYAHGVNSYNKGEMFVAQLRGVVGEKTLNSGLLSYYEKCKFKHPAPIDFERVMEKESGLELDWYFDEWINTNNLLDYAVGGVWQIEDKLTIQLLNKGDQLMPLDIVVVDRTGSENYLHIPLSLMLGSKSAKSEDYPFEVAEPWVWTHKSYELVLDMPLESVKAVIIDPFGRLADVDRENDSLLIPQGMKGIIKQ